MAYHAINGAGIRMVGRLTDSVGVIVTADTIARDGAVVDEGGQETNRGMTVSTIFCDARIRMWRCRIYLANCNRTVMATLACPQNISMIKAAVWFQLQKSRRIMTFIAFLSRGDMKFRLADSRYTIMAIAAITEYFEVIDKSNNVEPELRMTGLAHISAGRVIPRFANIHAGFAVMTPCTNR